ncbi:MAG: DUF6805 domain-containing protein, partial [Phocaeicola sp.]
SYQLRRNNRLITHVQIDYLADKDRDAHLLVNGEFIGRIASSAWGRVTQRFELPMDLRRREELEVRIERGESDPTSRILEVRLLVE